jgi:hypothetical protein
MFSALEGKKIAYVIAARLTRPLQRTIYQATGWWALEAGLELTEFFYRTDSWTRPRQLIVVRQSVKRKTAPRKTLSLFAVDPDIQGWRYGAFVTTLDLPMADVWSAYRAGGWPEPGQGTEGGFRAGCLQSLGFLDHRSCSGFAMLAYNLMSLFRQTVLRSRVQHTLSTLHFLVLAIGGSWHYFNFVRFPGRDRVT